jgi:hypothetical protein
MATRRYFQSVERWTPDRDDAYDFGIISKAMRIAHRLRIPDLEVELSLDDSDQAVATPFEKFLHGWSSTKASKKQRRKCRFA